MKINWNKTKTLYVIIIGLSILVIILIIQRGSNKPVKTDTSFQDSLIQENNRLKDSIKRTFKIYDILEKKYNNKVDSLMMSFKSSEEKIKKERQILYEKLNIIHNYSNDELTRAYSEFR